MPPADDELTLSNLRPAQKRRARKRVGRGLGSGKGRYSGRGIKGQKARSGSHKMRPGFEGGQMPIYMRLGKLRGPYSKDAMPIGPHRTFTVPVNVRDLERVFANGDEVTLELLVEKGLIKNTRTDVKVLGNGDLTKKLTVSAHAFSAAAREKIEKAGGKATALREPVERKRKTRRAKPPAAETTEETEAVGEGHAPPADEAEAVGAGERTEESDAEPEGQAPSEDQAEPAEETEPAAEEA
jgi:large subunit ribosomal protein L15